MKNRILRASEIKKALQMRKVVCKEFRRLDLGVSSDRDYSKMQVSDEELRKLSKIFGLDVIKFKAYSDIYSAHIFVENVEIFAHTYDFEYDKKLDYSTRELKKKFKEAFFETEDKTLAFDKMRKDELDRLDKSNYSSDRKYNWSNKYKTLISLEKHFNRVEKKLKTYEQIWQEYLSYRSTWKEHKKGDMEDYWVVCSYKDWYSYKY